ncbi:MAG: flagellar hook-basal body complex protein FliE [Eubacterium sp.]|jgi:flagellar hook-basal body complex protein FliE|nr:flagellar hook-basal body complex protein FliE [Eubacterium sp.]
MLTPIYNSIMPIETLEQQRIARENALEKTLAEQKAVTGSPSFLDVFKNIAGDAVDTQRQKTEDIINVMLGNSDDIEGMQANIAKAEVATDLLVTVKNTVVEAYNEIIKMSI